MSRVLTFIAENFSSRQRVGERGAISACCNGVDQSQASICINRKGLEVPNGSDLIVALQLSSASFEPSIVFIRLTRVHWRCWGAMQSHDGFSPVVV